MIPFIESPRIVKTNLWWKKNQKSGCLRDGGLTGCGVLSGVMDMFYILRAVGAN